MGILSVCGMFMNMQLLVQLQLTGPYASASVSEVAANGEAIAQMYFISMLTAFAGSLLIGLIARLPLVQVSSLGLGTVLISLAGTASGLTYYNLLAVSMVSSLLCTVLLAVPGLWGTIWKHIPAPVRQALPAAAGLLLAWMAMQLTGLITVQPGPVKAYGVGSTLSNASAFVQTASFVPWSSFSYTTDKFHPLMMLNALSVLLTFGVYCYVHKRSRHPLMQSLLTGTVFFLLANLCFVCVNWKNFGVSLDSMWGRMWTVGSEDAQQRHLFAILSHFEPGKVFTEGFDFSAYTANGGNVVLLLMTGIATVILTTLLNAEATLMAVHMETDSEDRNADRKVLLCNAACGVIAPMVGAVPLSVGQESWAGARDSGRTGLSSVAAAMVFLISSCFWIVPFLFATLFSYDIRFSMYGHYGVVLQVLIECSFAVVDAIMVIVGISMAMRTLHWEPMDETQAVAFAATVAGSFFLSSLVAGTAIGFISWLLMASADKKEDRPAVMHWVLGVVCTVLLFLITK